MNADASVGGSSARDRPERRLAEREADVLRRENEARQREDAERSAAVRHRELESHNAELIEANQKLVLATLLADELREQAQMMRRRQDEFLAMLAHELRNPLAPIRTALEVIAKFRDRPAPARMIDIIRRQVNHLVRLLDDLLDASRVTQRKVSLRRTSLPITAFIQQAVESVAEFAAARQQSLVVELPRQAVCVDGDPVRLTQVITNLLQNATKYTPAGGAITLTATASDGAVEILIRDNGMGISAEALPHVFELFVQDERASNRAHGGLGIGLTVVKTMVELHGGTVEARSDGLDRGSEFIVTLPRIENEADLHPTPTATAAALPGARILLVEDNADAAETLAELLRFSGHEVDVALDGPRGLELFDQSCPRVVLCDIGLPGMDGYEVVASMRARDSSVQPVFIALTGYGGLDDSRRALAAGFDRHLVKPADPDALLRLIDSALQAVDGAAQPWATSAHGSFQD